MKNRTRLIALSLAIAFLVAFVLANFGTANAMPISQNETPPWVTSDPAKSNADVKSQVTDPEALAGIRSRIPSDLTPADRARAKAGIKNTVRSFTSYTGNYGLDFDPVYVNHGVLLGTSVLGGLALTKPLIYHNNTVITPIIKMANSCLRAYYEHTAPANTWTTSHNFVVVNDCTSTFTAWAVNATSWANYVLTGNITTMPNGYQLADKTSQIRLWESNTANHTWSVDIWNTSTSSYTNFASYTGNNAGSVTSSLLFYHAADTNITSSWCTSLGAYNIAKVYGVYKYNGSSFVPTAAIDDGVTVGVSTPCLGTTANWEYNDNTASLGGAGYIWTVCGPSRSDCR